MEMKRSAYIWYENLKERDHLEDRHTWEGVDWIYLAQGRYGAVVVCCEYGMNLWVL
jgi:hypothetical protein